MSKYRREIATEVESLESNAFDANTDTILSAEALVDDAAFTPGTSKVVMIGAEFDDAGPDSVDEGDAGAIRMSAARSLHVKEDNSANIWSWDDGAAHAEVKEYFGGAVHSAHDISTDGNADTLGSVKLRDVVITNSGATNSVSIGSQNTAAALRTAGFDLSPGASVGFVKVDLATLFFCSTSAGNHTTVQLIGVLE